MLLELPKKGENITVKITGQLDVKVNKKGEKSYLCPCEIWCDPRRKPEKYGNSFMLRLNELWDLFEHYKALEELGGDEYKLDKHLIRLVGDVLTITCIDEVKDKETGKNLKSLTVILREDLKEIERKGEWKDIIVAKNENFYEGYDCVERNMVKVDEGYASYVERREKLIETKRKGHGTIHNVHNATDISTDISTDWK